MPSNASVVTTAQSEAGANLLFSIFVYVADAENGLSAREVQCLDALLADVTWCEDVTIKQCLLHLRTRYADYWKDYHKDAFPKDLNAIATKFAVLVAQSGDQLILMRSLQDFLARLSQNASPTLVRLGLMALPAGKQKARRDIEGVFANSGEQVLSTKGSEIVPTGATPSTPQKDVRPLESTSETPPIWSCATLPVVSEKTWKKGRTPVKCVAVIPETHDVKTFIFQCLDPVHFSYKPGQFATLELPIDGKTVRRSYTISSSPSRPYAISITVKRVPGGQVSNWLHDNMTVGFGFTLSGPHGDFSCFNAPAEKLLLIAAGSGITPIMSMLRWIVDTNSNADLVFLNNVRTPADVIFDAELKHLGTRFGSRLKLSVVPGAVDLGQSWNGPVCHFSEHLVRMLAPDFVEREVFVCGPAGFMDFVRATLEKIGHPTHRYHQESFGAPPPKPVGTATAQTVPAVADSAPPATIETPQAVAIASQLAATPPVKEVATRSVELVFSVSAKTVTATADDFILDIAEEHGIKLESNCRAGNCGTCKVKATEGTVEMEGQQALTEADIEDGYVLACIGRVGSGRVVLEA